MNEDKQRLFERFQSYGNAIGKEISHTSHETVVTLSEKIGAGYRLEIYLCPGLKLYLERYTLHERMTASLMTADYYPLGISVCLSGKINWRPFARMPQPSYMTNAGKMYLSISESDTDNGIIDCRPNEPVVMVSLLIEPDRFGRFIGTPEVVNTFLQATENTSCDFHYFENDICPSVELAARQLLYCGLKGVSRRLYLLAKTIELIALTTQKMTIYESDVKNSIPLLSLHERQQIHKAGDILKQNYASPPNLPHLARLVGLNQTKLKKGFKSIFKTCISGYILKHRMEQGKRLLENGNMNVSEVAYRVGYSERSHFTRAFVREFKCPPSIFLKLAKHNLS